MLWFQPVPYMWLSQLIGYSFLWISSFKSPTQSSTDLFFGKYAQKSPDLIVLFCSIFHMIKTQREACRNEIKAVKLFQQSGHFSSQFCPSRIPRESKKPISPTKLFKFWVQVIQKICHFNLNVKKRFLI